VSRERERYDALLRGVAAAPPRDPPVPRGLGAPVVVGGRYRLGRELGRDARAQRFAARDLGTARDVMVTQILVSAGAGPLERLARDARAAAALGQPHIAAVREVVLDAVPPFLVGDAVDGPTLRHRLADGPLPPDLVLALAAQLGEALGVAHTAGLVHGALSPSSIVLCADGVRILDFGMVHLDDGAADDGAYRAPETLAGAPPDARADLYAVGVALHEALVGRRPFAGGAAPSLPFSVPPALATVVTRLLMTDPDARTPSARALVEALAAASLPRRTERRSPRASRRWWPLFAAAAVTVALLFAAYLASLR
jgi:eukaryotic-like serine/threonine-protein kinase